MQIAFDTLYSPTDRARFDRLISRLETLGHSRAQIRCFSAPGRTELGGNHTDHQQGLVLAGAVDVDTIAAAAPNGKQEILLHSEGFDPIVLPLDPALRRYEPATPQALLAGMLDCFAQAPDPCGLDIVVSSTVLPGGGLSSSAAFEVLLATVLNTLWNRDALPPLELAKLGQRVENDYFGKPCGLLDQAASAIGGATFMDFYDPAAPRVEKLNLDPEAEGYALFIINCGAGHDDLTEEYAAIPREMKALAQALGQPVLSWVDREAFYRELPRLRRELGDRPVLRAIHLFEENDRVRRQRDALAAGDFVGFLDLVRRSGLSSWRFLQNISPAGSRQEQPMAVTIALCETLLAGRGACRVHGGGFAGTAQAYVPLEQAESFRKQMDAWLGDGACARRRIRPVGCCEILL